MQFLTILLMLIPIGIAVLFIYLKSQGSKPQVAADDSQFKAYCAALNNTEMHNLIISGGSSADRFLAVTSILNEASRRGIPTIVLHSGFAPFTQFSQNKFYDPCVGKDSNDIAEILTDAAANALNIDNVIHSALKFIVDLTQAIKGEITLADVIKFPCDDVLTYLDTCKDDGVLTDSQYDRFKQRYNNPAIRDNIYKVAPLFAKLKALAQKSSTAQAINFQEAVSERRILFFDLLTDSNAVLKELVFADINKLTELGKFWVVTEGISFIGKPDSKVDTVFVKNQNNITLIYSGEDVPALTSQTENTFETLTGGNSQLLLFAHISGSSAEKWSRHFGEENKTKVSQNTSRRTFDLTSNKGQTTTTEREYRFPPQHFMRAAKTTDLNNRAVTWGLNNGECYFIKEHILIQSQVTQGTGMAALAAFGGQTTMQIAVLPKIALRPTPLMLGAPQQPASAITMPAGATAGGFCNNCGTALIPNTAFCTKCGTRIAASVPVAAGHQ